MYSDAIQNAKAENVMKLKVYRVIAKFKTNQN
jgi:hypothetical protein